MSMGKAVKVKRYRERAVTVNNEPSLTRQSEAESCDINVIVRRLEAGQQLPLLPGWQEPQYLDVSEMGDFRDVVERVSLVEERFAALDAKVRERFGHDALRYVEFMADGRNRQEAIKLGLLPPDEVRKEPRKRRAADKVDPPKSAEPRKRRATDKVEPPKTP